MNNIPNLEEQTILAAQEIMADQEFAVLAVQPWELVEEN